MNCWKLPVKKIKFVNYSQNPGIKFHSSPPAMESSEIWNQSLSIAKQGMIATLLQLPIPKRCAVQDQKEKHLGLDSKNQKIHAYHRQQLAMTRDLQGKLYCQRCVYCRLCGCWYVVCLLFLLPSVFSYLVFAGGFFVATVIFVTRCVLFLVCGRQDDPCHCI